LMRGCGYSLPTRDKNAEALRSPQYIAASSADMQSGHDLVGRGMLPIRRLVTDASLRTEAPDHEVLDAQQPRHRREAVVRRTVTTAIMVYRIPGLPPRSGRLQNRLRHVAPVLTVRGQQHLELPADADHDCDQPFYLAGAIIRMQGVQEGADQAVPRAKWVGSVMIPTDAHREFFINFVIGTSKYLHDRIGSADVERPRVMAMICPITSSNLRALNHFAGKVGLQIPAASQTMAWPRISLSEL
jgi:hypothetical protein